MLTARPDCAGVKLADACCDEAKRSKAPLPTGGRSSCKAVCPFTLMANRLSVPKERATQLAVISAGWLTMPGMETLNVRLSTCPGASENCSPYHCRPLLSRL